MSRSPWEPTSVTSTCIRSDCTLRDGESGEAYPFAAALAVFAGKVGVEAGRQTERWVDVIGQRSQDQFAAVVLENRVI